MLWRGVVRFGEPDVGGFGQDRGMTLTPSSSVASVASGGPVGPTAPTAPAASGGGMRGADGDAAEIDISGYVRRARRLADLSQRQLAERTGIAQARVSRVENGAGLDVRAFVRMLAVAGLRLAVVDGSGAEVAPMPSDVFRDGAGRRHPAHLDVHALPEAPTIRMLFRGVDPVPSGVWHHLRPERDRLRRRRRLSAADEQLSRRAARDRASAARDRANAARR